MARKRLSRRELVEKDDITTGLESATNYVLDHGKAIAIAATAVIIVASVIVGLRITSANRVAAAESDLAEVIRIYSTIPAPDPVTGEILAPDGTPLDEADRQGIEEARFRTTVIEAARVQTEHPDQPAARIARYYEALGHRGLGNSDQAVAILSGLSESGQDTVHSAARYALAELYKERGELEMAVQAYQGLADSGGYAQEAVLYELGRLHEELSMPEEARGYYQSLIGEYPDSAFRTDADRALRRLALAEVGEDS